MICKADNEPRNYWNVDMMNEKASFPNTAIF